MPSDSSDSKLLTILLITYGTLLIYASLMPYNFSRAFDLQRLLEHDFWAQWPFNPHGRISGSDLLSNLVLYAPLGFLLTTKLLFQNKKNLFSLLIAVSVCSFLSLSIELLQSMIHPRTPSATDWLLNSVSGLLGALAGAAHGKQRFEELTKWLRNRWRTWPLDIFSLLALLLYCADGLAPFLPTIRLSQVARSLRRSHFDIIDGFAQHPWHWWLVNKTLPLLLLTLLLAHWNGAAIKQRRWAKIACLLTLFALGLECLKPLIATRNINIADVASAGLGAAFAIVVGPVIDRYCSRQKILDMGILVLLVYLCYQAWAPFNFTWDVSLKQRLPTSFIELIPFYHYAMGATLEHARLFLQTVALTGILVYLLRLRYNRFATSRHLILFALGVGFIAGLLQEGGQLFLLSRTPSLTDIYCYMIGGFIGAKAPGNERL